MAISYTRPIGEANLPRRSNPGATQEISLDQENTQKHNIFVQMATQEHKSNPGATQEHKSNQRRRGQILFFSIPYNYAQVTRKHCKYDARDK